MPKRQMNDSEELAYKYLEYAGFNSIVYEPDGNSTPDFLVNGTIAAEVRRLNQNVSTPHGYQGLEQDRYYLDRKITGLLATFGASKGESWFIHYQFSRPVLDWNILRPKLLKRLKDFRDNISSHKQTTITIDDCFTIRLIRAGDTYPALFLLGGSDDSDSGGWVLQETQKNVRICIEKKTSQIAAVRHKYNEWWLILADRIGFGIDDCDWDLYRRHLAIAHDWDKVILLSPLNHRRAFEIPKKN